MPTVIPSCSYPSSPLLLYFSSCALVRLPTSNTIMITIYGATLISILSLNTQMVHATLEQFSDNNATKRVARRDKKRMMLPTVFKTSQSHAFSMCYTLTYAVESGQTRHGFGFCLMNINFPDLLAELSIIQGLCHHSCPPLSSWLGLDSMGSKHSTDSRGHLHSHNDVLLQAISHRCFLVKSDSQ